MKLISEFGAWVWSVFSAWYGWVGASATAGLVGFGQGMGWWGSPGKRTYIALLIIGFLVSVFVAWRRQYIIAEDAKAKVYNGRPIIVLEVLKQPAFVPGNPPRYENPQFRLRNCGDRTARFLNIEPVPSTLGTHQMRFNDLVTLEPQQPRNVRFIIDDNPDTDNGGFAWTFFHDNPIETVLVFYDITIHFRDAGESGMEEIVRLRFDVETKALDVAAVPYTQRPPQEPIKVERRRSWLGRLG
jgi:hypothetical protein